MNRFLMCFAFFMAVNAMHATALASSQALTAVRTRTSITVDGKLDEDVWQRPGFSDLRQREPQQGEKGSERTEILIAYDDGAIYVGAILYDRSPDSMVARPVRRDFVYGDPSDGLVFYLDPYHDHMTGYLFYVSAAGTMADGVIENDGRYELSWDGVWEGSARMGNDGCTIEMRIPFSQLRFREGASQEWGVNVERYISRRNETDLIAYTPRNENGFVSRFPSLIGLEGLTPPSRLEVLPYLTGKAEYLQHQVGDPFNVGHKFFPGAGMDLKVGLGTSLTLDGTVNPDFGQVEVDPAVVNLTDVETSFQEKRPFFTEGMSIFRFGLTGSSLTPAYHWNPVSLFYSRRIGRTPQRPQRSWPGYEYADAPNGTRILGAGKISGRIGDDWKIGSIHAVTQREFAQLQSGGSRSELEIEPLTYYGVYRAQRDFDHGREGIGFLSTYTKRAFSDPSMSDYLNDNAFIAAADGWAYLDADNVWVTNGWVGISRVAGNRNRMIALQQNAGHYFQRPDASYLHLDSTATSLSGYAGRFILNKQRGPVVVNAALGFVDPGFEANDLGYLSFSDILNAHFLTGYRWMEPTAYYQNANLYVGSFLTADFGGNRTGQGFFTGGEFFATAGHGGGFELSSLPAVLDGRRTRGGPLMRRPAGSSADVYLYSDNRVWWVINGSLHSEAGGYGPLHSVSLSMEFKVTPTFTCSIGPAYTTGNNNAQYVGAFSDPVSASMYGKRYVFAHLEQEEISANLRANWILTPWLSFQIFLQPYIATGSYTGFKELKRPESTDFLAYGDGASTSSSTIAPDGTIDYTFDADGPGPARALTIGKPDFNYLSLRGNAVLRWEYMPGSVLYLVWTQSRSNSDGDGAFEFSRSFDRLVGVKPDNIFMAKISYWWGR